MKRLPTGRQNFRVIIEEGRLYVDKTRLIYELLMKDSSYFLSRPRRFGKTLLVAILKEIFRGNQDLFKGLYIAEQTNYDWKPFPILHFNFAAYGYQQENIAELLVYELEKYAKEYEITLSPKGLSQKVENLVTDISQKHGPIVFLVDEYDKPIVDFLTNRKKANANRKVLKTFFSPFKILEEKGYVKFLFITGVSKFSKVSIFSDLNNLTDLTINKTMAGLTGITQQELLDNFEAHIQYAMNDLGITKEQLLGELQRRYDGYSWDGKTFVYNPYSLLSFFDNLRFGNFWFATGTPTFLVEMLRNQRIEPQEIENKEVKEPFFDKFTIKNLDIYSLLFQTGYLTIKETYYRPNSWQLIYKLGYPNQEVKESFLHNLLEVYA